MTTLVWQNRPFSTNGEWAPRADVIETENGYRLDLDLPGVKREELDIQVANDTVTIKGERKLEGQPDAYQRVERPHGSFSRIFYVPEFVEQSGIQAKLSDGVLHLTLPRREETKPKQIQVQVQ